MAHAFSPSTETERDGSLTSRPANLVHRVNYRTARTTQGETLFWKKRKNQTQVKLVQQVLFLAETSHQLLTNLRGSAAFNNGVLPPKEGQNYITFKETNETRERKHHIKQNVPDTDRQISNFLSHEESRLHTYICT